eukprot:EG_transcript_23260
MSVFAGAPLDEDEGPKMDPKQLEQMFGEDKVRRLFEGKELMEHCKEREHEVVHTEGAFTWMQDKEEVTVKVPIPAGTKAKDVAVTFHRTTLQAGLKGQPPLVAGDLTYPVTVDECAWSLVDGALQLTLWKARPVYWAKVLA